MGIVLLHCAAGLLLVGGFITWNVAKKPIPISHAAEPTLILIGIAAVAVTLAGFGAWLVKSARVKPLANPHKFTLREVELILCASYEPGASKLLTLMDQAGHVAALILDRAYERDRERKIWFWAIRLAGESGQDLDAAFLRDAVREAIKLYAAI